MRLADRITTVLFWVVATAVALFLSVSIIYNNWGFLELRHILFAGFAVVCAVLGIRQCYRTVFVPASKRQNP